MSKSNRTTNVMLVHDLDSYLINSLVEKYIPESPTIDCILCIGPFSHDTISFQDISMPSSNQKEKQAVMLGAMSSMIAALELIQCRVIYLPTEADPIYSYQEQLYLTPNSVNIHARRISLFPNLFISGFTETPAAIVSNNQDKASEDILLQKVPEAMVSNEGDNDDDMDGVEVACGLTSIHIIEQVISQCQPQQLSESPLENKPKGIFILNYKYTHTLNHFLFHMPELLEDAGVHVCIAVYAPVPVVQSGSDDSKNLGTKTDNNMNSSSLDAKPPVPSHTHLPKKFGNLNIVTPVSLRLQKQYTILKFIENNVDSNHSGNWVLDKVDVLDL